MELLEEVPSSMNANTEQIATLRVVNAPALVNKSKDALFIRSRIVRGARELWGFGACAVESRRKSEVQMFGTNLLSSAFNERSLDQVLQFTNVPWIIVIFQSDECGFG